MQGFVPSIVAPSPLWFDAQGTVSVVLRLVLSKLPDMLKDAAGFCLCYPPPLPPHLFAGDGGGEVTIGISQVLPQFISPRGRRAWPENVVVA